MRDVILNWELGSNFGWGIMGLNIFAQCANDAEVCTADHAGMDGWDESDLEEIDLTPALAYQDRAAAAAKGTRARQWLLDRGRTRQQHAATLKAWVLLHPT
jgi:hypothetical protein